MKKIDLKSLKALVIENNLYIREELVSHYSRFVGHVDEAADAETANLKLKDNQYDIVSIDLNLTDDGDNHRDGLDILPLAKSQGAFSLILSGYSDTETIDKVSSIDPRTVYIKKSNLFGSKGVTERVFNEYIGQPIIMEFCNPLDEIFQNKLVTNDDELKEKLKEIFRAALYNQNIMLLGETGVGKGYIANILVDAIYSVRRKIYGDQIKKNFHKVNLSSIDPGQIEAALFGVLNKSSSGEVENKIGIFEAANGGVLFLDEIGTMPLSLQDKLLSALSQGKDGFYTFNSVGNHSSSRKSSFLLITGSCEDLENMLEDGKLREDFYHRIASSTPLEIPPLRERKTNVKALINHFLKCSPRAITIDRDAMDSLLEYQWPGNIRQLEKTIRELTSRTRGKVKKLDLPSHIINKEHPLLTKKIERFYTRGVKNFILKNGIDNYFQQIEKMAFKDAMMETGHKVTKAASSLGIGMSRAYAIKDRVAGTISIRGES